MTPEEFESVFEKQKRVIADKDAANAALVAQVSQLEADLKTARQDCDDACAKMANIEAKYDPQIKEDARLQAIAKAKAKREAAQRAMEEADKELASLE